MSTSLWHIYSIYNNMLSHRHVVLVCLVAGNVCGIMCIVIQSCSLRSFHFLHLLICHIGARLSWEGYGAGLTIEQATDAVRAIPNILSLRHTDSKKPSALYYIKELQVSTNLSILAENNLEKYLMGTERSDVWAYAYLNKIGLQWNQLRILLDAFPTLTCIGTDVDWRLLNRGLIRDRLDEFALMFLRKRLQIGTMDVFTMLKVSSYNCA